MASRTPNSNGLTPFTTKPSLSTPGASSSRPSQLDIDQAILERARRRAQVRAAARARIEELNEEEAPPRRQARREEVPQGGRGPPLCITLLLFNQAMAFTSRLVEPIIFLSLLHPL